MPVCKNCHSRIDKFNKDRCPICGVTNPFEGVTSDTIEITTQLDVDSLDYKPRKRKTVLLLTCLLGFTGAPLFYVYRKKAGIIIICLSLLLLLVFGLIGYFVPPLNILYGVLIALGIELLLSVIIGLVRYFIPNRKDGRGDFII